MDKTNAPYWSFPYQRMSSKRVRNGEILPETSKRNKKVPQRYEDPNNSAKDLPTIFRREIHFIENEQMSPKVLNFKQIALNMTPKSTIPAETPGDKNQENSELISEDVVSLQPHDVNRDTNVTQDTNIQNISHRTTTPSPVIGQEPTPDAYPAPVQTISSTESNPKVSPKVYRGLLFPVKKSTPPKSTEKPIVPITLYDSDDNKQDISDSPNEDRIPIDPSSEIWKLFNKLSREEIFCTRCNKKKTWRDGIDTKNNLKKHKCWNLFFMSEDQTKLSYETKLTKEQLDNITLCLLKVIVEDERPFRLVRSDAFTKFVAALNPEYKIPSYDYLIQSLKNILGTVRNKMKEHVSSTKSFSLTGDLWKSIAKDHYFVITIHYFAGTNLVHRSLACIDLKTIQVTGEVLKDELNALLKDSGVVATKVKCMMVTDAGSNKVPFKTPGNSIFSVMVDRRPSLSNKIFVILACL